MALELVSLLRTFENSTKCIDSDSRWSSYSSVPYIRNNIFDLRPDVFLIK